MTTVREIKILKALNHPNIVEIIDMVVERSMSLYSLCRVEIGLMVENPADRSRGDVFMVFPYMDHDLCGLLSNSDFKLNHSVAKLLMRQILQGMDYIHAVCPSLFIFNPLLRIVHSFRFDLTGADDRTISSIEISKLRIS